MTEETLWCPRGPGPGNPFKAPFSGEMTWREDHTCSHCGSLDPDLFMARLEAGDVLLVPTDKSYKAYLQNAGGEAFQQRYRACPKDATCTPLDCTHWTTREQDQAKFYFQHMSEAHMHRLIELLNSRKVRWAHPGYFYRLPFFMAIGSSAPKALKDT